jgi:hypothetical protein
LVHRQLTVVVAVCAGVTGLAHARPAAVHRTVRCSLAHGAEGDLQLTYLATNVSCARAAPVFRRGRLVHGCNLLAGGCPVDRYMCRDPHPQASQ